MSLFERTVRDGPARMGKYTSGDTVVATPAIIDPKEMFPDVFSHPFSNTPPEFPDKVRWPKPIQYSGILNALVGEKPDASDDAAVIFPGCHTLFDNPRQFTELLIDLKERFPMDTVIFSGRISKAELLHERKRWYDRLVAEGRLDDHRVRDEWHRWKPIAGATGYVFFGVGIGLLLLIVYAMVVSRLIH